MAPTNIRPVELNDFKQWLSLYWEYARFYKIDLTDNAVNTTWSWLMEPAHVCCGLVAEKNNSLVGLPHFRGTPSPLRGQIIGFIDDLFILPNARSDGTAVSFIVEVQAAANLKEWGVIRWVSRDDNYRARGLYDKLAHKTDWILYEMATE